MSATPLSSDQWTRWLYAAAGLSALAGFIHILAAPSHFDEWFGYGLFFLLAATAQFMYALMLTAYKDNVNRDLLLAGGLGTAAILALWLVTRTLGIPFLGPEAGKVEAVGALDAAATIVEAGLLICLVVLWRGQPAPSV